MNLKGISATDRFLFLVVAILGTITVLAGVIALGVFASWALAAAVAGIAVAGFAFSWAISRR